MDNGEIESILARIAKTCGLDLRDYQRSTLARRIEDRMSKLGHGDDLAGYRARLERDEAECDTLARSLFVRATSFFRDPAVFEALERTVVPALLARQSRGIRAWVVGVATGEEAYSLAFTIARCAVLTGSNWDVLASDIDSTVLDIAREGRFSSASVAGIPEETRAQFMQEEGGAFVVRDPIRDRVRFAQHDFMGPTLAPKEAIVAFFDLVLIRNVLLYMDHRFRKLALERADSIVRPGGALLLGIDETIPEDARTRFEPFPGVDRSLRIYRRGTARPDDSDGGSLPRPANERTP